MAKKLPDINDCRECGEKAILSCDCQDKYNVVCRICPNSTESSCDEPSDAIAEWNVKNLIKEQ